MLHRQGVHVTIWNFVAQTIVKDYNVDQNVLLNDIKLAILIYFFKFAEVHYENILVKNHARMQSGSYINIIDHSPRCIS